MHNIKVRLENGIWVDARDYQKEAFLRFSTGNHQYTERDLYNSNIFYQERSYTYNKNGIKFTISRQGDEFHGGIILKREDNTIMPICNWDDVMVFLLNHESGIVNWYPTTEYQKWAYFDFSYDTIDKKNYKSIGTTNYNKYIEIPLENLEPNIIFSIGKNNNGTIYYESNNIQIRISNNDRARAGYRGFYNRMTMDVGLVIEQNNRYLDLPNNIIIEETLDESEQCGICYNNKQNIVFISCMHSNICSNCYVKLIKPRECPMCKKYIENIIKKDRE
jgi:hypothetical protein